MPNRNLVQHHGKVREQLNAAVPMGLVRDDKLSAMAKAVALEIWSHAEGRHQSARSVAQALGIDKKTAFAAIAELQERGWLVREVHHKISEKGNRVWDREVWHLQMTNTPFTKEQHWSLSRTSTGPLDGPPPVRQTDRIEVKGRSAPEVHSDRRSEGELVRQTDQSGEDDPQRESEPDSESVSSSPRCYSTTHFRGATDPFASLPSGSSAQGGLFRVNQPAPWDEMPHFDAPPSRPTPKDRPLPKGVDPFTPVG